MEGGMAKRSAAMLNCGTGFQPVRITGHILYHRHQYPAV